MIRAHQAAIEELTRNGTCIRDVTLCRGENCIVATWPGAGGSKIGDTAIVVISREHPKNDKLEKKWAVQNRGEVDGNCGPIHQS